MEEAEALRTAGRWYEAVPQSTAAVALDPDNVIALHNLGVLLTKLGRLGEGEAASRRAIGLAPNAPVLRHALAHNLLAQGRFAEAWPLYDARIDMPDLNTGFPRSFPFPRWRGEPLAGKRLAVFPEQGFGDQIQFARFVPRLAALGATVTLLTMPALVALFRRSLAGVTVVPAEGATEFDDPDYWITLHELPAVLGIAADAIPGDPYLCATGAPPNPGDELRIGVMTKGNPRYANDALRSLPPDLATKLVAGLPGTVVSLDPNESGARDFAESADLIAGLDLVVSVDTSVAHLAGALGKPCLLLIPGFSPDWRWGWGSDRSRWYPAHRLYRGTADGGWAGAVERLLGDVRRIADARGELGKAARLRSEGRYSQAITVLRKAVTANPRHGPPLHNLARLLTDLGRLKEGEAIERRALAIMPHDARFRFGLALNLLRQGRYGEAWPLWQARAKMAEYAGGYPRGIHFPHWQGEELAGKRIAVLPEQGFGDQLMFARFLPWLRKRAAGVVLFAPPTLQALFAAAFPDVEVVAAAGEASFARCDVWAAIADLPARADARRDALPDADYLRDIYPAPPAPGRRRRIGVMSAGSAAYVHDRHRTLPAADAAALRAGLAAEAADLVELDPAISGAADFADTAEIVRGLDLVVSVDTAVGHLAGAMGKSCFLLVPGFATDWRWGGGEPNAWYPRHRLFHGAIDGGWAGAIAGLHAAVRALPS